MVKVNSDGVGGVYFVEKDILGNGSRFADTE
jgi:hypothetical protein